MESIETLAGPTGLNVSISTLRNFASLLGKDLKLSPFNPKLCSYDVFMEVLGIDAKLAIRLYDFFRRGDNDVKIEPIDGVDEKLAREIREYFVWEEG